MRVLYAKSALDRKQAEVKMHIGCDGLEIQLLSELVNGSLGNYFTAEEVFNLEELKDLPVVAVHAPLLSSFGIPEINLESLARDKHLKLFRQICAIANYYGNVQNKEILVVVHSEMKVQRMRELCIWNDIVGCVAALLMKYPRVKLCIENVTPLRDIKTGIVHLADNFKTDNVEMVKLLRDELNTERIGTVLDVCHAMITKQYMDAIYNRAYPYKKEDYSLPVFFNINQEYISLIHLADFVSSGYGKGQHAIPFMPESSQTLEFILELCDKYCPQTPITIEVNEKDLMTCKGYQETRQLIKEYDIRKDI